jgi:hypothetical protein
MKIYYWNSRTDEYVPGTAPVELELVQTLRIFNSLHIESFLGVELSSEQFFRCETTKVHGGQK